MVPARPPRLSPPPRGRPAQGHFQNSSGRALRRPAARAGRRAGGARGARPAVLPHPAPRPGARRGTCGHLSAPRAPRAALALRTSGARAPLTPERGGGGGSHPKAKERLRATVFPRFQVCLRPGWLHPLAFVRLPTPTPSCPQAPLTTLTWVAQGQVTPLPPPALQPVLCSFQTTPAPQASWWKGLLPGPRQQDPQCRLLPSGGWDHSAGSACLGGPWGG